VIAATVIISFHWDGWGDCRQSMITDEQAASAGSYRCLYTGPASRAAKLGHGTGRGWHCWWMASQRVAQTRETTDQSQASKQIWAQSLNNTVGYKPPPFPSLHALACPRHCGRTSMQGSGQITSSRALTRADAYTPSAPGGLWAWECA